MAKPLKVLASLLLLVVLAALALPHLVDPNDYRDEIAARLAAATGRELSIAGDLGLSLFPRLRVSLNDTRIASVPGFEGEPPVRAARIELDARWLPLLQRRLEVERIRIRGLRVHLVRDAAGKTNWRELPPSALAAGILAPAMPISLPSESERPSPATPSAAPPSTAPLTGVEGAASPEIKILLKSIEIADGEVLWDDRMAGERLRFEDIGLSAGPVRAGEPMDLRLSGSIRDLGPGAQTLADAQARVSVVPGQPTRIDGIEIRLGASGGPLGEGRIQADGQAQALLDLEAGTLSVSGIEIRSGDLHVRGEVNAEGLQTEPILVGRLTLTELDLRAWLEESRIAIPPMADAETLRRIALALDWRLTEERLDAEPIELRLDQTQVRGNAAFLRGEAPAYRFALTADRLDLDRYLPPTAEAAAASQTLGSAPARTAESPPLVPGRLTAAAASPASGHAAIPPSKPSAPPGPHPALASVALAHLDLDGTLRADELRLARLVFGEADLRLLTKDGMLRVENRIGRFYQGRLEGRGGVDLRASEPAVSLSQRASGISVAPLLIDLTGSARLSGQGEATADLSAQGVSRDAVLRTASGQVYLALRDGQVQGFDLERIITTAQARLVQPDDGQDAAAQTPFGQLTASATVERGVLSNDDLFATSDYLEVRGRGRIDLPAERFDYLFEPVLIRPPKGRGIKELEGVPIPVRLTGSFDQPEWKVDLAAALRAAGQRRLGEELGKEGGALKRLEEGTGIKGLEQGLRRLFER